MTDDMNGLKGNIIPFGKHKGRLVEELILDDPAYLQWLSGQEWFRSKFAFLNQVIINRGSEPEETPDHNAMQVKFLDDGFCLQFLRCVVSDPEAQILNEFNAARTADLQTVVEGLEAANKMPAEADEELARKIKHITEWRHYGSDESRKEGQVEARKQREDERERHVKRLAELDRLCTLLSPAITQVKINFSRTFEVGGVDVVLKASSKITWPPKIEYRGGSSRNDPIDSFWSSSYGYLWQGKNWEDRGRWCGGARWERDFGIELKPVVGDDYPAVLRQMKRHGSNVLFVGEYTGVGASAEQFVKTFATAWIRVVFARELEPPLSESSQQISDGACDHE
jgi:hypothetical protein